VDLDVPADCGRAEEGEEELAVLVWEEEEPAAEDGVLRVETFAIITFLTLRFEDISRPRIEMNENTPAARPPFMCHDLKLTQPFPI
jgi:hypothetical protein